jgi:hypothetical protein
MSSCKCRCLGTVLAAALTTISMGAAVAAEAPFVALTTLQEPDLPEISGLAASRRWPGLYWAHNDSGGRAELHAFDRRGRMRARIAVVGAQAVDWEDLALFERDGRSWLAIADIGDNLAWRSAVTVYLLPEPDPSDLQVRVERRIDFRYPQGPRDAEALAVDVASGQLLILEKGPAPAGFYALPLDPPPEPTPGVPLLARRLADLRLPWPQALPAVTPLGAAQGRVAATAMDLSGDGRVLAVMTYTRLYRFSREPGEDWAQTLARAPASWKLPRLRGFEAMAIEADSRSVVIAPEAFPTPVFRAAKLLQ